MTTTVDLDRVFADLSVESNHLRILNLMNHLGFDTIHVNYSGGGDSGSVDMIDFFPEPKSKEKRAAAKFVSERFEDTLSQPIWDMHGSFADGGGYSVNGTVVWDAKAKTVDINGTHHYYECDEEGEETDCEDEDFSEAVFEYDSEDPTEKEDSYDCLFAYAQFVLKDKFPGEYHNRMLAAAMQKEPHAVEYVKWCEGGCK